MLSIMRWLWRRVFGAAAFAHLEAGQLIDNELQLREPEESLIDSALAAAADPSTVTQMPEMAKISRRELIQQIHNFPRGRQLGNPWGIPPPGYYFWMCRCETDLKPAIVGGISLRIGHTADIRRYFGHIGYHVYPAARGNHFAERSVRLLLPLAQSHGLEELWITTDPANGASRRTCQRLGATLIDTVAVPKNHVLYDRGERLKCRYRLQLRPPSRSLKPPG